MINTLKMLLSGHVRKDESGQDLAEYALLIGFLALVVVVAVQALGVNLTTVFTDIGTAVSGWLPVA
jgi:pilus assembly protein Flp/PilA